MLKCLAIVAGSLPIAYVGFWVLGRKALSLGKDEGFDRGYWCGHAAGFRSANCEANLEANIAQDARRWRADCEDDWLAT
jgi:hypothetical protein